MQIYQTIPNGKPEDGQPVLFDRAADFEDFGIGCYLLAAAEGWTIGGALTGWLLAYFGFKANVIQSDFAQTGICMMMSIFPAIATMLSAFFISRYPLNEKRLYEISTELEERRKK